MPLAGSKVGSLPTLQYVSGFLTPLEEACVLKEIECSKARWTAVSGRRLQVHGGTVHRQGLLKAPMPRWMDALVQRISNFTGIFGEYGVARSKFSLASSPLKLKPLEGQRFAGKPWILVLRS
jgi:hypothetical protein